MCNCIKDKKKDYQFVRSLAIKFVQIIESDVRIFSRILNDEVLYDFEPAEIESGNTEVELLIYTPEN